MARLRYNGLSATLGASLTSSATSVTFGAALTHSNGTNVPTITGSDYIPLSVLDASGHLSEIVWLTAYTTGATTGTILRGQEGTTGISHSSGDKVSHGPTALDLTFIGARVYNSTNIACATGADTVLTFNSERYDTDTIHSTSSNTGRLTATTAGKYHITGTIMFAGGATGARSAQIRLNGATGIAIIRVPAVTAGDVTALAIDTDYDLAAGDYVELIAYQTSGGSLNVSASGNISPEFAMHKIG